jgi:NAD+-dependent secondary alcohol dehydrogenase Adh1
MYCSAGIFPGVTADGGYAEYLRTTERAIVVLPEGTEPTEIAPHADAGLTAFRAVRKAAALLKPGQVVAVIGTGGLGHIGIQLLHEMTPARVIAIDRSESGRQLASGAGADWVLESAGDPERVVEITGGVGADVVIDFVGEGDAPQQGVALLKQGGTYLVVGYGGELHLPTLEVVLKEIRVEGNLVGSYTDLSELMRLVGQGRVKLSTKKYPLSDALQALEDLDSGNMPGRGVLVP